MPYVNALFDPSTEEAIKATATTIKGGSAFTPYTDYHVPLLGSLHVYSEEAVAAAIATASPLPGGRFLKWELHGLRGLHELRAMIEFDDPAAALRRLHESLPRGRPWRSTYVALGTIDLQAAQRDEFLAAVTSAFPMSADVTFTTSRLGFHNNVPAAPARRKPDTSSKSISSKSRLNPKAQSFVPGRAAAAKVASKPIRGVHKLRHLKWERKPATNARASTLDELIKTSSRAPLTKRATMPASKRKAAQSSEPPRLSTGLSMSMASMGMALSEAQ